MPKNDGLIRPFLDDLRRVVEHEAVPLGEYADESHGGPYGRMMPEEH